VFFERRDSPRVRPGLRESIEVQIVAPGVLEVVRAVDISEGGVGILVEQGLGEDLVGAEVELLITMPSVPAVYAKALVRRVRREHGLVLGMEFVSPPPKTLEAIRAYVDRRMLQSVGKIRIGG
jgi:c-di-GMP-binding flagellar brake protein YcgR